MDEGGCEEEYPSETVAPQDERHAEDEYRYRHRLPHSVELEEVEAGDGVGADRREHLGGDHPDRLVLQAVGDQGRDGQEPVRAQAEGLPDELPQGVSRFHDRLLQGIAP